MEGPVGAPQALFCVTYAIAGIFTLVSPLEVAQFLRIDLQDGAERYCAPIWRLVGMELLGMAMVSSRQVRQPHRGISLGLAWACVVMVASGLAVILHVLKGWNIFGAMILSGVHVICAGWILASMGKMPLATRNSQAPTVVLMIMTAMMATVGADYCLFSGAFVKRIVQWDMAEEYALTQTDVNIMMHGVRILGFVKVCFAVFLLSLCRNASKWDLYSLGVYSWAMLAVVGYMFINVGADLFVDNEFYAIMALYGAFAAYFGFSVLTYTSTREEEGSALSNEPHSHVD